MNAVGKLMLYVGIVAGLAGLWFFNTSPEGVLPDTIENPGTRSQTGPSVKGLSATPGRIGTVDSHESGLFSQKSVGTFDRQSSRAATPVAPEISTGSRNEGGAGGKIARSPGLEIVEIRGSAPGGGESDFSGDGTEPAREISIPVPEGEMVPAVFFDAAAKPLPQQTALDRIAEEFEQNVSEVPAGLTQTEVWEAARKIADERYLTLFGYQAYNIYHIRSAKDALKEKRKRANATEP